MTEIAHKEKLQQLEQQHVQLLEGLDELNLRLEQALCSERNAEIPNDE